MIITKHINATEELKEAAIYYKEFCFVPVFLEYWREPIQVNTVPTIRNTYPGKEKWTEIFRTLVISWCKENISIKGYKKGYHDVYKRPYYKGHLVKYLAFVFRTKNTKTRDNSTVIIEMECQDQISL